MGEVVGDLLPLAIGVAVSPVPIIAVILMLLSPRARTSGVAFMCGWALGIALVTGLVTLFVNPIGASDDGQQSDAVPLLKLGLGVLILVLGVREWRSRPRPGDTPELPSWMASVDSMTPLRAAGLAALLAAVNPKNLTLCVSAGSTVGAAGLSTTDAVVALAVFLVLASLTVAVPVVAYLVAQDAVAGPLEDLRAWLTTHSSAVMSVVLLVIGVALVGQGIGGL